MEKYKLITKWKEAGETGKERAGTETRAIKEASDQSWTREVAGIDDWGDYGEKQKDLHT